MFNLDKHTKQLAEDTLDFFTRLQEERDIGLRNTFQSTIKENLVELERLMRLREALKIKVTPEKTVQEPKKTSRPGIIKDKEEFND